MSYRTALILPLLAALAVPVQAGALPAAGPSAIAAEGVWLNPSGSVAVRTAACAVQGGQGLCGRIVWASAKARADAQDSGIASLVGIELLQDYRPVGGGAWRGTVYVPDMGRRFDSRIEALSPARLKVSGCVLGGWVCRSQVWTRIAQVPA